MPLQLISVLGLVAMLACAWLLSNNRKRFPWRTVIWGMVLQFAFAIFILKTPIGLRLFQGAQVVMDQLNAYAYTGAKMVFGPLGDADMLRGAFGASGAYVFAISVTATIILISSLSSLLYYWGVLQKVVAAMAWVRLRVCSSAKSCFRKPNRARRASVAISIRKGRRPTASTRSAPARAKARCSRSTSWEC